MQVAAEPQMATLLSGFIYSSEGPSLLFNEAFKVATWTHDQPWPGPEFDIDCLEPTLHPSCEPHAGLWHIVCKLGLCMTQQHGNDSLQIKISNLRAGQEIYLRRPLRYGLPDDMAVTFAQACCTAGVLC